ncbi:T9SS type A sorting domain-containing protein [Neolewinella aurantiaca]|uniref:T9SS type A sorting domain-containing protein n=1 Tax=Neolewinella aurantiaca TaxID=2602767 RepID=A0A5C7FG40_9BACT|nr:T9SS type A sorting domain-containing protein [Neolewinella aurantiaca]TXF89917.1 T9SS type A sorting domain-containing protein [Neolewinella aurantiaca]
MNDRLCIDLKKLRLCLLLVFASTAGLKAQCNEVPFFSGAATEIERLCHFYDSADFTALPGNVNRCYRVDATDGTIIPGSIDARLQAALVAGGDLPKATSSCSDEVEICLSGFSAGTVADCTDSVRINRTFTARNTAPEASNAPASFAQTIVFLRPDLESVASVENVVFYFPDDGNGMAENPSPRPEDYPMTSSGQHLSVSSCGYTVTYQDGERDTGCGNNFTFVRAFSITDECADENRVFSQVVRVGDQQTTVNSPPVLVQNPLMFGTNINCAAIIDTRLTGLTIADICDGSSRLDAYVFVNSQLNSTPLGPYRVFSSSESQNFTDPIPIGRHIIRYLGQDSYGAETILDIDFEVTDQGQPTAVCQQSVSVDLDENGFATLNAADLNRESFDDCGAVNFTIARGGSNIYRGSLTLGCEDFGTTTATLRVTDETGRNRSECTAEVTVTDPQRPTCSPPQSVSITCRDFADNLPVNLREVFTTDPTGTASLLDATFGAARGSDNCDSLRFRQSLTGGLSECGNGQFIRSFVVNDQTGFTQVQLCQQTITIRPYTEYSLRLPGDQDYDSCSELPSSDDLLLRDTGCDLLTVTTETDTLPNDGTACYQLRLTHTFINWCEYDGGSAPLTIPRDADNDGNLRTAFYLNIDPVSDASLTDDKAILDRDIIDNNGNEIGVLSDLYGSSAQRGHFRYVQLVNVTDNTVPVVDIPAPDNGQAITADCLGSILLSFSATDDCANPETTIAIDVDVVDRNGDDTITQPDFLQDRDISPSRFTVQPDGSVEVSIRFLPIGSHLARLSTTDNCGNHVDRFVKLEVEDARAPTPDCSVVNNVMLTPDPAFGGVAAMVASDFIRGPATVCTETPITYSLYREETAAQAGFVPQPGESQLQLDCSDLGQNLLRVYAIAEGTGRHDYCNISVNVTSDNDICAGRLGIIDGYVLTETGAPMAGVEVFAATDGQQIAITTESDGYYRFDGLAEGADYTIRPYHNDDPVNGLSTFDISLVSDYLTQNEDTELSPYQLIAADANNSRAITILDLIEIREILLGINDGFDNNTSWRFVPADYDFPNPGNPWQEQFPEMTVITNLTGARSADFVAVKVGDVNGSATPTQNFGPGNYNSYSRTNETFTLELQQQTDGTWALLAPDAASLTGIQFSLALPAGAKIVGGIAADFWAVDQEDILSVSYVPEDGRRLHPEELLLEFDLPGNEQPQFAAERLARLAPEAYHNAGWPAGLRLTTTARDFNPGLNVYPNPVFARSMLSFNWPEREALRFELIDAAGRVVTARDFDAAAGHNLFPLEVAGSGFRPGVYFVRLRGQEGSASVRVVISGS